MSTLLARQWPIRPLAVPASCGLSGVRRARASSATGRGARRNRKTTTQASRSRRLVLFRPVRFRGSPEGRECEGRPQCPPLNMPHVCISTCHIPATWTRGFFASRLEAGVPSFSKGAGGWYRVGPLSRRLPSGSVSSNRTPSAKFFGSPAGYGLPRPSVKRIFSEVSVRI